MNKDDFVFKPLTKERFSDLEKLFGKTGAYGGCWCMFWRLTRNEFSQNKSAGNRKAMADLVDNGAVPGILAYRGEEPVAWCAIAPRRELDSLNRSRVLKPIDDQPVWSITCFFASRPYRKQGMIELLIRAALQHAKACGATMVEAYPHAPSDQRMAPVSSYMGFPSAFERVGFTLCREASKAKWIMRYPIQNNAK